MKKIFTFFLAIASAFSVVNAQSGNTYAGNGAISFGGGVGNAFLTITENGGTLNFSISTRGFQNDILVLYFDTKAGGYPNTSSFTDVGDNERRAISGTRGSNNGRTTVTFANTPNTGFGADYAIAVEPAANGNTGFAGIFNLSNPGNFSFVADGGFSYGNGTYNFSVKKLDLGLISASSFNFVGTLISQDAYRSNETFGNSVTAQNSTEPTNGSAGYTGTTTFTAFSGNSGYYTFAYIALPLKLESFSGKNANSLVTLNWTTSSETDVQHFVIEGSANGTTWSSLYTVAARNTTTAKYTQSFTDAANTLYRLKMVNKDGKSSYSAIINLKSTGQSISLMNNPVKGAIRLSINADADKYTTTVYSMDGKAVASRVYNHPGGSSTLEVPVTNLAKGNYILKVTNASEVKSLQVMVD